jgi:hypothetical protein
MTLEEFQQSLSTSPSEKISAYLLSLWYDAKGDWDKAHSVIAEVEDENAAWVHAYLHRKEGDIGNADYWYRQAGKKRPDLTLEKEWEELAKTFLEN